MYYDLLVGNYENTNWCNEMKRLQIMSSAEKWNHNRDLKQVMEKNGKISVVKVIEIVLITYLSTVRATVEYTEPDRAIWVTGTKNGPACTQTLAKKKER